MPKPGKLSLESVDDRFWSGINDEKWPGNRRKLYPGIRVGARDRLDACRRSDNVFHETPRIIASPPVPVTRIKLACFVTLAN